MASSLLPKRIHKAQIQAVVPSQILPLPDPPRYHIHISAVGYQAFEIDMPTVNTLQLDRFCI